MTAYTPKNSQLYSFSINVAKAIDPSFPSTFSKREVKSTNFYSLNVPNTVYLTVFSKGENQVDYPNITLKSKNFVLIYNDSNRQNLKYAVIDYFTNKSLVEDLDSFNISLRNYDCKDFFATAFFSTERNITLSGYELQDKSYKMFTLRVFISHYGYDKVTPAVFSLLGCKVINNE